MLQIAYNRTKRTQGIKYIVIHDTGNTAAGANARSHYAYFNAKDRQSSADFFVDDKEVLQVNDYTKYYTWHCGDGKGKYGITNNNSIGIEICINSDGDYNTAFDNTVALTKQLMSQLNIDIDHVVRHYDASRKNCPQSMNRGTWEKWHEFKEKLKEEQTVSNVPLTVQEIKDIFIQEIYPPNLGFYQCDCPKNSVGVDNYFNAGFFAQTDKGTIPVGNLADSGIIYAQSKDNPSWINVAGKPLTTLYVKNDGSFGISKMDMLEGKDIKTAISGIPIVINGRQIPMEEIKAEGYDGSELYNTWHGFLGYRGNDLVYVGAQCDYGQMVWILIALGIRNAIKLDGGGSYILHNGVTIKATSENRRINNVGMWHG
jgi:N-acetylmuramoyl-L-alanine amidase